ncbi:hypothetical protein [Streptomyces sp. NPDC002851]
MRSLPLMLVARLLPVVALATAGWAWTTGPYAPADKPAAKAAPANAEAAAAEPTYRKAPAPCDALPEETVKKLVPEAKTAGKELSLTDRDRRRTCTWSALKGYDYRWLDVSYEVTKTEDAARTAYNKFRTGADGGTTKIADLGDQAASAAHRSTKDGQKSQKATVTVRDRNALVRVTYTGSDFEDKGAPEADTMREGAVRAAKAAVSALPEPTK